MPNFSNTLRKTFRTIGSSSTTRMLSGFSRFKADGVSSELSAGNSLEIKSCLSADAYNTFDGYNPVDLPQYPAGGLPPPARSFCPLDNGTKIGYGCTLASGGASRPAGNECGTTPRKLRSRGVEESSRRTDRKSQPQPEKRRLTSQLHNFSTPGLQF